TDVTITLEYLADDYAEIYIDDILIDKPSVTNMTHSAHALKTLRLRAGRHCVRAEVLNNPAYNMAFCASGAITTASPALMLDGCCAGLVAPVPAKMTCTDVSADCDRITQLAPYYLLLCDPQRAADDPFYS